MTNLYQTTANIHTELKRVEKKTGIEIEVGAKFYIDLLKENRNLEALIEKCKKEPTIKNSLYVEQQKLRIENWKLNPDFDQDIAEKQIRQILIALQEVLGENPEYQFRELADESKKYLFIESQAEALCQKWLDGLNPLFTREPETVLKELLETLKSI